MTSANRRSVGILEVASADPLRVALWDFFKQRLRELGWTEGQDVNFEFRWADGHEERLPEAAAELIRGSADVLVTTGTAGADAASRATSALPIVMATGTAPETPRANVAGVIDLPPGLSAMRLELLSQAVPNASRFGLLTDRANSSSPRAVAETQAAARALGLVVKDYWIQGADHFGDALLSMKQDGMGGFVISPGAMFFARRKHLAALAVEHGLPSMSVRKEYAEAGSLMCYGAPIRDNYRRAAGYVDRILRGAKPAELPVDGPTEFDFVINLKTAQTLGLTVPASLLGRAETIGL